MNRIVAVSGGVDSVVLLDILTRGDDRLVVAHVDHGIRGEESAADARFVAALARSYKLPFIEKKLKLGIDASEEAARAARYSFLFEQASQFDADIVTAHHQEDMIGSIIINLQRGTGWRGLSVLARPGVKRPLLGWSKRQIYAYAITHRLEWVEDSTNRSKRYLRNRLRESTRRLDKGAERQLARLRHSQIQLRQDIDRELTRLSQRFGGSRYPYIQIEAKTAVELLRYQYELTYPAAERLLLAIKTGRPGTMYDIANGMTAKLTRTSFVVVRHLE